jgi:hypothetical protein
VISVTVSKPLSWYYERKASRSEGHDRITSTGIKEKKLSSGKDPSALRRDNER